jgi:predicted MFS family arabinose efflux permease
METARVARFVLGGNVRRSVRPVAAMSFTYYASFSTFWVYVGVYAVKGLHWPASRVGLLFLASAPAAAVANYLSGRTSDRVGRKPLIVGSFLGSAANMTLLAAFGHRTATAFVLIIAQGVIGAPAFSLDRVLVADIVGTGGREEAYAGVRVASNLGALVGPPLGALLVVLGGWTAFLLGIAAIGLAGAAITIRFVPRLAPVGRLEEAGSLRTIVHDRPFALLLLSSLLAYTDYCGFETVLPVLAVATYGLAPSTWGLLVAISPALIVVGQLRLTRASARIPPAPRFAGATLLMGLPFLALLVSTSVAVIAAVIVLFIAGEMVWMPTSQAVAAELAPESLRGTYFGALSAMTGPAWTLAPFIAFELRDHAGVHAVWLLFAAIAVVSAAAGAAAVRAAGYSAGWALPR